MAEAEGNVPVQEAEAHEVVTWSYLAPGLEFENKQTSSPVSGTRQRYI